MAKGKYTKNDNIRFVNPYNFVRTNYNNGKVVRSGIDDEKEKMTGCFHCCLIAKTPIGIPDTEHKTTEHAEYPFMTRDGKAMIPGSSIRGCIRSLYETLTDSCFVTMDDEAFLSTRINPSQTYSPALLVWNKGIREWQLYEAERKKVPTIDNFKVIMDKKERCISYKNDKFYLGDVVDFKANEGLVSSIQKNPNGIGYLYVGEPFGRKKYESIFVRGNLIEKYDHAEIKKAINGLIYSVKMYQDAAINKNLEKNHSGYKAFNRLYQEKKVIPVWYNKENSKVLSLSMAAIGRTVFSNTINDMVGDKFSSCKTRKKACPACQLFGMAKGEALGSRIRIGDAFMNRGALTEKRITLKELGSPRTGYYIFYEMNGKRFDEDGACISGRKFYWHDSRAAKDEKVYQDEPKINRNASMQLAKVGSEFLFDVYFDGITKEEYEALKWTLTLGDNSGSGNVCHKIGHGKSIGLGSAKISIQSEEIRLVGNDSYQVTVNQDVQIAGQIAGFNESVVDQVERICDFKALEGMPISYPYIEAASKDAMTNNKNLCASHQWFTQNKNAGDDAMKLKPITDKDQSMAIYEVSIDNDNFIGNKNNKSKNTQWGNQGNKQKDRYKKY